MLHLFLKQVAVLDIKAIHTLALKHLTKVIVGYSKQRRLKMPDLECSNARASHNGLTYERYASKHLKGLTPVGLLWDALYKDKPLEVKSCEEVISDSHAGRGHRTGRIMFWDQQHKALMENGGAYYIIVHAGRKVIKRGIFPAGVLNLPEFEGMRGISWKKIFSEGMV
jgi:hypothetical protein